MELDPHNPAHSRSGFQGSGGIPTPSTSWIASSPAIAPRDPLFFSLHGNIDRLWAKWQWLRGRNTPTDVASYNLQGSHATPAAGVPGPSFTTSGSQILTNRTLGQYAEDTLWPWDNTTGGAGTAARPNIAVLTPFPVTLTNLLPFNKPTVKLVIDYAGVTLGGPATGLGYGYDDFFPY
jgi:tyrosinase